MKILIIYDETGRVLLTSSGDIKEPKAVNFAVDDVPEGYYVESVDPETWEPILKSIPKTLMEQRLEELEAQLAAITGTEE